MTQLPEQNSPKILTINGGSSSIKFAVFNASTPPNRIFAGQIERNASTDAQTILKSLQESLGPLTITAIGHRIVHGGTRLFDHQLITPDLLAELRRNIPLDLTHLSREIALIESFQKSFPTLPQVACFDTAFHKNLPQVAKLLPIPRKYLDTGIRRLGFHGLSYTYLMSRLPPESANGKIILAHLGSGASMAAVHQGKPIDTTMCFTPTAGLVMGTRPGDIDPGLLIYLMREEKLSLDEADKFISEKCGLLGISQTSSDMRDLTQRSATDPRAADAIALFCYQAKKFIGSLFAALGGLDTLVFSGGIGEHSPESRAGICQGLESLGIQLDPQQNASNAEIISTSQSRVIVRIIPTDEESVIAQAVSNFLPQTPH